MRSVAGSTGSVAGSTGVVPGNSGTEADSVVEGSFVVPFTHKLVFTRGLLEPSNTWLRQVLMGADNEKARVLVFVDEGVRRAWPHLLADLSSYAAASETFDLVSAPVVVPGGETAKNDAGVLRNATSSIHDAQLCRQSYVVVIGGGAVLDVIGFAAAISHRGVRLVRCPTTTLSQGDGGVGVKNGVNAFGKKNYLGTFAVPWAVLNDEGFLQTLSDRDWRCGLSEAVKVALIKDGSFFDQIESRADALAARDGAALQPVLRRSAELHLQHIVDGGDPFETDTARPLDFGHWSAHKIEQMTDFEVKHGEAVAMGVALDAAYCEVRGALPDAHAERVMSCLQTLGFRLRHESMSDTATLMQGLEEFREHLGGTLTITLLRGIGRPFEAHEIDEASMRGALERVRAFESASLAVDP